MNVDEAVPSSSMGYVEGLPSRYSGVQLSVRLEFAAHALRLSDVPAAVHALELAVATRKTARNVQAYIMMATELGSLRQGGFAVDSAWVKATTASNMADAEACEVAVYAQNVPRDVSRSALLDYARFSEAIGDDAAAVQHFDHARDLGVSARQTADTTLALLELFLSRRDWQNIDKNLSRSELLTEMSIQK